MIAHPATFRRRRGGFTLLELIVATTVTVLVTGSTLLLVRNLTAAQMRVDGQSELQQEARAAAHAIATALRNAYRPPAGEQRDVQDWPLLVGEAGFRGDLAEDTLRLLSVSHRTVRREEPESDVREIEFGLAEVEGRRFPVLTRRTDPALLEPDDRGGVLERLAHNIVSLEIAYYDGLAWRQDWHSHDDGWPLAVRISLLAVAERGDGQLLEWPVERLVSFPYHNTAAGRAGGGEE